MKPNSPISMISIALLMLALPLPALAALGGSFTSVQDDQTHMKGSLTSTKSKPLAVPS